MRGAGNYQILNCVSYNNVENAFFGEDYNNLPRQMDNTYEYKNGTPGAVKYRNAVAVSDTDYVSLDDLGMLGPRNDDGSLPVGDFLRPGGASGLGDGGADTGLLYFPGLPAGNHAGSAPAIGPFETALRTITITLPSVTISVETSSTGSKSVSGSTHTFTDLDAGIAHTFTFFDTAEA